MKNPLIILCFILTCCTPKEATKTSESIIIIESHEKIISIEVNKDQEVFLNGEPTNVADISQKLIEIKSNDTLRLKKDYLINLAVDKNTNTDFVTEIKQQLRKADMLKLKFSYN